MRLHRRRRVAAVFLTAVLPMAGCDAPTFEDGFETPYVSDDHWLVDADAQCGIDVSGEHARHGDRSLRIVAPKGLRCEIVPRIRPPLRTKFLREPYGEERWYRFSVFIEDLGAPAETESLTANTIIAQWHSSPDPFPDGESGRGPPLALRIHGGRWGITYGWDASFRSASRYLADRWHWAGPVETGRWVDWTFRVIWSPDRDGLTEVWRDSELVMQRTGPNAYNDIRGVYLKLGVYHPTDDQIVIVDSVRIGNRE